MKINMLAVVNSPLKMEAIAKQPQNKLAIVIRLGKWRMGTKIIDIALVHASPYGIIHGQSSILMDEF